MNALNATQKSTDFNLEWLIQHRGARVQPNLLWMKQVLAKNQFAKHDPTRSVVYYPTPLLNGQVFCRNAITNKLYPFRVGSAEESSLFKVRNVLGPNANHPEALYYSSKDEFERHFSTIYRDSSDNSDSGYTFDDFSVYSGS